jgi:hypothetical protein
VRAGRTPGVLVEVAMASGPKAKENGHKVAEEEQDEDEDDDSDDEDAPDDDQMMAVDAQLAAVFRLRQQERTRAADAKRSAQNLKLKALDLLEAFAKREPASPLLSALLLPLYQTAVQNATGATAPVRRCRRHPPSHPPIRIDSH